MPCSAWMAATKIDTVVGPGQLALSRVLSVVYAVHGWVAYG
jgi:hypothetical protein